MADNDTTGDAGGDLSIKFDPGNAAIPGYINAAHASGVGYIVSGLDPETLGRVGIGGYARWVGQNGAYVVDLSNAPDGPIEADIGAGYYGDGVPYGGSGDYAILDKTAPDAPPAPVLTHDTGSTNDNITSDPSISYAAPAQGDTLIYSTNGTTYGSTKPSFATDGTADGSHTVYVKEVDAAGNPSEASSMTFMLDTTAPAAPTAPVLTNDTGTAGDKITKDPAITYAPPAQGNSLIYSTDGTTYSATKPSFATDGTADGPHTVYVKEVDTAGNASGPSSLSFTLDTTPPAAAPAAPVLANDTGTAGDKITKDPTITYAAPAQGNSLIYSTNGTTYSATKPSFATDGTADGAHTVFVEQVDVAGNASAASSLTFTLDTTAPAAPAAPTLVNDTGTDTHDKITSDPTINYPTPATGDTLLYSTNGTTYSSTKPSFATDGSADGAHTVYVKEVDGTGNASAASSLTFTLKTTSSVVVPGTPGTPGAAGGPGQAGKAGGKGGLATATNTPTTTDPLRYTATATGGAGGVGGAGGAPIKTGGIGGAAGAGGGGGNAVATVSAPGNNSGGNAVAIATANGGMGGAAGVPGTNGAGANGGAGGTANAAATTHSSGGATATATATGGTGGTATGLGHIAGAGGAATGKAEAATSGAGKLAEATLSASGGYGGAGLNGASGGAGAAVSLKTTQTAALVKGSAPNGILRLGQYAVGGDGGASAGGKSGAGGAATSSLTFTDTTLTNANLSGRVNAEAGYGGNGTAGAGKFAGGGVGGAATATGTLNGAIGDYDSTTGKGGFGVSADGGDGGNAQSKANGGAGGAATASATSTSTANKSSIGTRATAGDGGDAASLGNGGAGGKAKATLVGTNSTVGGFVPPNLNYYDSNWGVTAQGGAGGDGDGAGHFGGAGGTATGSIKTTSGTASGVGASIQATGGAGGKGTNGATGGVGGAATLTNAATGATKAGVLSIQQIATGGAGGASTGGKGGAGGAATSSVTVNDWTAKLKSNALLVEVDAIGGAGGAGQTGGNSGAATATADIRGIGYLAVDTYASSGAAGIGAIAGNATAKTTASAGTTDSTATAISHGGVASATNLSAGLNGSFEAKASTLPTTTGAASAFSADAKGTLSGTSSLQSIGKAVARAAYNAAGPTFDKSSQAVAQITGAPTAAAVAALLKTNTQIRLAFPGEQSSHAFFAMGELGGAYDTKGTGDEIVSTSVSLHIDPSKMTTTRQSLVLGLYGGTAVGSGFKSLTFDVTYKDAQGGLHHLLPEGGAKTFASVADLGTYFNDHAIDLGSLAPGASSINGGSAFDLTISLAETFNKLGSGYYTSFLLGDPPPAGAASSPNPAALHQAEFAKALFDGYFGNSGVDALAASTHPAAAQPTLVADQTTHPVSRG